MDIPFIMSVTSILLNLIISIVIKVNDEEIRQRQLLKEFVVYCWLLTIVSAILSMMFMVI